MIVNLAKNRPVGYSENALLLVPLWHLLSRSTIKPFFLPILSGQTHKSEGGVWWGITDRRLQEAIDSLKLAFNERDLYASFFFKFKLIRTYKIIRAAYIYYLRKYTK